MLFLGCHLVSSGGDPRLGCGAGRGTKLSSDTSASIRSFPVRLLRTTVERLRCLAQTVTLRKNERARPPVETLMHGLL